MSSVSSHSLAPFAVPLLGTLGRSVPEADDDTRTPFQRDRDRIIHAQAFRRLQGKTQVFVAGEESDHVRTRLTHTLEVAQIARDMARHLDLHEDLAESIALAHDLGHPPFGHMGEQALDAWMRGHGSSFEHNEQSLRIVTLLERHSLHAPGLNLQQEIIEGLQKHRLDISHTTQFSLEAEIVNLADEIAYVSHDCEDGLRAGLFTEEEVSALSIMQNACMRAKPRGTSVRGSLIHLLVTDAYAETSKQLQSQSIRTLDDVYAARLPIVLLSAETRSSLDAVRAFLASHMYAHPRVLEASMEGQAIVTALCDHLLQSPNEKVKDLMTQTGSSAVEAVKDYVAGMTDNFARTVKNNMVSSQP